MRRAMYSHHEIGRDEHRAWFERLRQDRRRRWYLYRDAADVPQGVVYFTEIDPGQATAFWGFYARPAAPSGTGLRILVAALDIAFGELALHKLNGEVLADNDRSLHLHTKVGFTEEGRFRQQHFDGETRVDVVRLSLLASDWVEQRPRLAERLRQLDALAAQSPPAHGTARAVTWRAWPSIPTTGAAVLPIGWSKPWCGTLPASSA